MDPALFELIESAPAVSEVEVLAKLRDPGQPPEHLRVVTQFGDIVTARVPPRWLATVWASDRIVSLKAPRAMVREPSPTRVSTSVADMNPRGRRQRSPRRPSLPEDGAGVVLGVLDWGVDLVHADLRDTHGGSRFEAVWIQEACEGNGADPYGYGRILSRAEIDRALESLNPYAALAYAPWEWDAKGEGTHGTHVAGICGGSGLALGSEPGIAPGSDMIFVHLATTVRPSGPGESLGDSVRVLEGLDFIRRTARDRPWVANLSLGAIGGPHDGTTLLEQAIDQLLEKSPSGVVVCSAGNYFQERTHASGLLHSGEERALVWMIPVGDRSGNKLEIWYSGRERFEVALDGPSGQRVAVAGLGERSEVMLGGLAIGRLHHRAVEPNSNDHQIEIWLRADAPCGPWTVSIRGVDVVDGRFDAWIERDEAGPEAQSRFEDSYVDPRRTVGTICTGTRSISVGAYDPWDPESLPAPFSSAGPTRDGRPKPDLLAPGVEIVSARSSSREEGGDPSLGRAVLAVKSGTSMAAPHVSGTVALMLQAAPRPLEIWETRAALLSSCRHAQEPDSDRMGSGYLDIGSAVTLAREGGPGWLGTSAALGTLAHTLETVAGPAFHLVAGPGERLYGPLKSGDLLVVQGRGDQMAVCVMMTGELVSSDSLSAVDMVGIERRRGAYAHVSEIGSRVRAGSARMARRVTDPDGWVPRDRAIYRKS